MTAFIPGQAVEYIDDDVHVRGRLAFQLALGPQGLSTIKIEEIVRGDIRHSVRTANLRAYDPQKTMLDRAQALAEATDPLSSEAIVRQMRDEWPDRQEGKRDTLRDLLREAAEALRRFANFPPRGLPPDLALTNGSGLARRQITAGDCYGAGAVLAKIERALK